MPLEQRLRLNQDQTRSQPFMQSVALRFDLARQGDQHQLLRQSQPMFPLALSLQDAQLLAQQGNFEILLIGSDAHRGEHIQDEGDETVKQREDHTCPMPKAIILTEAFNHSQLGLILTGRF